MDERDQVPTVKRIMQKKQTIRQLTTGYKAQGDKLETKVPWDLRGVRTLTWENQQRLQRGQQMFKGPTLALTATLVFMNDS